MLQVECAQLHASNEAGRKQEAKHKWQYQKQLRQVELERDGVKQRELTCVLHESRTVRSDERLRARENEVEVERVVVENARAVGTADLKRAREAYFTTFTKVVPFVCDRRADAQCSYGQPGRMEERCE